MLERVAASHMRVKDKSTHLFDDQKLLTINSHQSNYIERLTKLRQNLLEQVRNNIHGNDEHELH